VDKLLIPVYILWGTPVDSFVDNVNKLNKTVNNLCFKEFFCG